MFTRWSRFNRIQIIKGKSIDQVLMILDIIGSLWVLRGIFKVFYFQETVKPIKCSSKIDFQNEHVVFLDMNLIISEFISVSA